MTTFSAELVHCGVCGKRSEQMIISSTSSFGAMDLDTRPAPLARFNLPHEIQRCPSCGYCARSIEVGDPSISNLIESETYRTTLEREPPVLGSFLCAAIVAEANGDLVEGGWLSLGAAWLADDDNDSDTSAQCRSLALMYWEEARRSGQGPAGDPASSFCLEADLRRIGDFKGAKGAAMEAKRLATDPLLHDVADLEIALCNEKDQACHSLEEIDKPASH